MKHPAAPPTPPNPLQRDPYQQTPPPHTFLCLILLYLLQTELSTHTHPRHDADLPSQQSLHHADGSPRVEHHHATRGRQVLAKVGGTAARRLVRTPHKVIVLAILYQRAVKVRALWFFVWVGG